MFPHNCSYLLVLYVWVQALISLLLLNVLSQLDTAVLSLCWEHARWRLFFALLTDCGVALGA